MTIKEFIQKSYKKLFPDYVKFALKEMFSFYLLGGILFYIILVMFKSISSEEMTSPFRVQDAAINTLNNLNIKHITMNYLILGILYIVLFLLTVIIVPKIWDLTVEQHRRRVFYTKNYSYILFLTLFFLSSFTADQLDLIMLLISLIILFKFMYGGEEFYLKYGKKKASGKSSKENDLKK